MDSKVAAPDAEFAYCLSATTAARGAAVRAAAPSPASPTRGTVSAGTTPPSDEIAWLEENVRTTGAGLEKLAAAAPGELLDGACAPQASCVSKMCALSSGRAQPHNNACQQLTALPHHPTLLYINFLWCAVAGRAGGQRTPSRQVVGTPPGRRAHAS